jgi:hypothetical protein
MFNGIHIFLVYYCHDLYKNFKYQLAFSKKIKCLKVELQNQKISYGIEMEINKIDVVFADMILGHFL